MAGVEGERPHFERTPQQSKPTEHHKPLQDGGNGTSGLPPTTLHERAKPPQESEEAPAQWGSDRTKVQEPRPEAENTPAKRGRGRPRLPVEKVDLSTSVQPGNWLDRVDDLAWKEQYMKQLERSRTYKKTNREKVNEQRRRRYKERKEQGRLPSRKQQPKQVFPDPTQQE
jgi:hypothetical protein